jgi:hypothetical protein
MDDQGTASRMVGKMETDAERQSVLILMSKKEERRQSPASASKRQRLYYWMLISIKHERLLSLRGFGVRLQLVVQNKRNGNVII